MMKTRVGGHASGGHAVARTTTPDLLAFCENVAQCRARCMITAHAVNAAARRSRGRTEINSAKRCPIGRLVKQTLLCHEHEWTLGQFAVGNVALGTSDFFQRTA